MYPKSPRFQVLIDQLISLYFENRNKQAPPNSSDKKMSLPCYACQHCVKNEIIKNAKILSCLVSYRDPQKLREGLEAHSQVEVPEGCELNQYVFDNSELPELTPELEVICRHRKSQLVVLKENIGVSGAYAQACEIVLRDGYDYLWLWDQDSFPPKDCLKALLKTFSSDSESQTLGAVAPLLYDPDKKDIHYVFYADPFDLSSMAKKRFPMHLIESGEVSTTYFINSGTLVARKAIEKIGAPDVDFFMDLVDYDYSSRMVAAGFRILVNADTRVAHRVGTPKPFIFFGKTLIGRGYSNFRYYYQARNEILMAKKSKSPFWLTLKALAHLTKISIRIAATESHFLIKILAFKIGILDGLIGKKGKTYPLWIENLHKKMAR
jgi:GT2 family glycosyltransferase